VQAVHKTSSDVLVSSSFQQTQHTVTSTACNFSVAVSCSSIDGFCILAEEVLLRLVEKNRNCFLLQALDGGFMV